MLAKARWRSEFVGIALLAGSLVGMASPDLGPADPVAGREHWAFRPLEREAVEVNSGWARSAIDEFVWLRLQEEGLRPAEDANRRDLLRRAYYQLIGLTPSAPAENSLTANSLTSYSLTANSRTSE